MRKYSRFDNETIKLCKLFTDAKSFLKVCRIRLTFTQVLNTELFQTVSIKNNKLVVSKHRIMIRNTQGRNR